MKVICDGANWNCIKIDKPCAHATLHPVFSSGTGCSCMNNGEKCRLKGKNVHCIEVHIDVINEDTCWN